MLFYFVSVSLAVFGLCASQNYTYVDEVDLSQYTGTWYQVYGDLIDRTFEGFGSCITATYTLNDDDGNVSVFNRQVSPNGTVETISGVAYYDDGNEGGELTVDLEGTPGSAPYWIVSLGPVVENQYSYSIVSDNKQLSLFVLTRDVNNFFRMYDDDVLSYLDQYGFDKKFNSPIITKQTECVYSDDEVGYPYSDDDDS
jgi:lipocalin